MPYNLTQSVRVSTDQPLDGKYEVANDAERDLLITGELVRLGHQIYHVADGITYSLANYPTVGDVTDVVWESISLGATSPTVVKTVVSLSGLNPSPSPVTAYNTFRTGLYRFPANTLYATVRIQGRGGNSGRGRALAGYYALAGGGGSGGYKELYIPPATFNAIRAAVAIDSDDTIQDWEYVLPNSQYPQIGGIAQNSFQPEELVAVPTSFARVRVGAGWRGESHGVSNYWTAGGSASQEYSDLSVVLGRPVTQVVELVRSNLGIKGQLSSAHITYGYTAGGGVDSEMGKGPASVTSNVTSRPYSIQFTGMHTGFGSGGCGYAMYGNVNPVFTSIPQCWGGEAEIEIEHYT